MNSAAALTIRQRLEALKPQVLEVARRYGASNLRMMAQSPQAKSTRPAISICWWISPRAGLYWA